MTQLEEIEMTRLEEITNQALVHDQINKMDVVWLIRRTESLEDENTRLRLRVERLEETLRDISLSTKNMNQLDTADDYRRGFYDGCKSEERKAKRALVESDAEEDEK